MMDTPMMPHEFECEDAARQLYDFLDGRLTDATGTSVETHLHACAECAKHYHFAREVLARIPLALADEQVSPALRERILTALRAEGFSG
jgi:anti-sigma factor (TIGR02949 family)